MDKEISKRMLSQKWQTPLCSHNLWHSEEFKLSKCVSLRWKHFSMRVMSRWKVDRILRKFTFRNLSAFCNVSPKVSPQKHEPSNQIAIHGNSVMKKSNNIRKKTTNAGSFCFKTFCTWNFLWNPFFNLNWKIEDNKYCFWRNRGKRRRT